MTYLMAGQLSELERLQLQSRVWEPAGDRLLAELGDGTGRRALDVGCGCLGWLRLLSRWVGPSGTCVGTDVDERLLTAAAGFIDHEGLGNVDLAKDDLFASALPERSFDLVHARFQLAPLGRAAEQLAAYTRLVRPGGVLVLEDPDTSSWTYQPAAPAAQALIGHILEAFRAGGGDFDAGRQEYAMLVQAGLKPRLRADVTALEPGHPYLRLPVQFAASLRPRLLERLTEAALDGLLAEAEGELSDPARWGLTFTLVQTWAEIP
jgi:ubiquinone/menaquinone biosynthesis C-methylase UbiE